MNNKNNKNKQMKKNLKTKIVIDVNLNKFNLVKLFILLFLFLCGE